jgi:hypothetical protein
MTKMLRLVLAALLAMVMLGLAALLVWPGRFKLVKRRQGSESKQVLRI